MPLPDERPRQSVANLIGRFETQTKRLSLTASSPSRSSSVVSHITGDSSKEEVKEKREWPPKSVSGGDKLPPSSFNSRHLPPVLNTTSPPNVSVDDAEIPLTAKALSASQRQAQAEPNSFLENWRKDVPAASAEMEPEPTPIVTEVPLEKAAGQATPTAASVQKFGAPTTPRTPASKTPATRPPASGSSRTSAASSAKTPAKTPLKSPAPKQSLTPSVSQPLRPQHTGQSVASSTTGRRPVTKTPTTPARAKTPSRPEAASRAKTPTSARPKTPSTGLFAPTAASLARSRNAAPQLPTPVKKATLSTSSMDRLSKPTAASLLKARSSAGPATTTSRSPAASPRVSGVKPKAPSSPPPKANKELVAPKAAAGATVAAAVASIGAAAVALEAENQEVDHVETLENGHEEAHEAHEETIEPPEEVHDQPESTELGPSTTAEPEAEEVEDDAPTPRSQSPAHEVEATHDEIPSQEAVVTAAHNGKDDLEDIVNLLETVSITKPLVDTTTEIPDDLLEIPDEEER